MKRDNDHQAKSQSHSINLIYLHSLFYPSLSGEHLYDSIGLELVEIDNSKRPQFDVKSISGPIAKRSAETLG